MERIKNIYKSFIVLFSEGIWSYYAIVLFTSIEWTKPAFFDLTWWVIAGVLGYTLNVVLLKRVHPVFLAIVNIAFIGFMIIQNWRSVVPEGDWGFGLTASIGLSFIFIRSLFLVSRHISRQQMLRRFEGNIIYYIIFASIFTVNEWGDETFHLLFIVAIIVSLVGMVLTLQSHEQDEGNQITEVLKVGQSSWFTGVITALLICIPLISLVLLLPTVNKTLYSLVIVIWEGLKWLGLMISKFFIWLLSLLPEPQIEGELPDSVSDKTIVMPNEEEALFSIPYVWIIGGIATILILFAIWILSKLIRNRQFPKAVKPMNITIYRESLWQNLLKNLKNYLQYLNVKWRVRFPYFYYHSIYWYYYQLQRWAKKNGFHKIKSETSREYVNRIIRGIPEKENNFRYKNKNYNLSELLSKLNEDYQATYYGTQVKKAEEEYKLLIEHLKNLRFNSAEVKGTTH